MSWNVNGLRSVLKRNFLEFVEGERPDILCLQETKCTPDDVEQLWPAEYTTYWNTANKAGYSGTAIFCKERPLSVQRGLGEEIHDQEGRLITAEFQGFFLLNVYVPNSKRGLERLPYRRQWNQDLLSYMSRLAKTKSVVACGDLNVAHTELDISNPKRNEGSPGFSMPEREDFTRMLEAGFIDTFREFEKGGGHYTWWSPFSNARERNLGWRIDYILISAQLRPRLKEAYIRCNVMGSDHCPVGVELHSGAPQS
jgi:exodeoxyribonuclease III